MASLKEDDLFGVLCCPFLPTWFVHQWMASGFLSLERIKAHKSFKSKCENVQAQEKLGIPGQHTGLFSLNESVHSSKADEASAMNPLPKLLPPAVASVSCFQAWTVASSYQNNSFHLSLSGSLFSSDDTGRGSDLRPSQAFPLPGLCLLPHSRINLPYLNELL